MNTVYFATSNPEKIQIAQAICTGVGISVKPVAIEIDEIQGEDPEMIVRDKAKRAFEVLGEPVVVSDDTWNIHALKGFPGAYMKSINYWFEPEDFIRLMQGVKDRRITLRQYLAYTDGSVTEVFTNDITGVVADEVRGVSEKAPSMTVIELDSDKGKTIAEVFEQDSGVMRTRLRDRVDVWHSFVEWSKNR